MKRTLIQRAAAALACVTLITTAFGTPVRAQESPENIAKGARVTQITPGNYESDTLSAVNDGVRYPSQAHNAAGANPYAWTNYDSAQIEGIDDPSYLTFDFGPGRRVIGDIVVYYFVDSWSASLPKEVELFGNGNIIGGNYNGSLVLVEEEQVSPTCIKHTYRPDFALHASTATLVFRSDDTSLKQGNTRCVGVYEVEIYDRPDVPVIIDERMIGGHNGHFGFAGMYSGSTEFAHEKWVDYARDGKADTIWHSDWNGCDPEDMWIEVYLGKSVTMLTGLRYLPRSGNRSGDNNGRIAAYEVQVGVGYDNDTSEIIWKTVASGRWEDTEGWKEARFDEPVYDNETLHVRLVAKETYGVQPNKWVSAAEVQVIAGYYRRD